MAIEVLEWSPIMAAYDTEPQGYQSVGDRYSIYFRPTAGLPEIGAVLVGNRPFSFAEPQIVCRAPDVHRLNERVLVRMRLWQDCVYQFNQGVQALAEAGCRVSPGPAHQIQVSDHGGVALIGALHWLLLAGESDEVRALRAIGPDALGCILDDIDAPADMRDDLLLAIGTASVA